MMRTPLAIAVILAAAGAAWAHGRGGMQVARWVVAGGGGESAGGGWTLSGTAGQHDAGVLSGGQYTLLGGFWGAPQGPPPCYVDCNQDGSLTVADFACFRNAFLAGDGAIADCNGDTLLTVADFACFRNAFLAGCP